MSANIFNPIHFSNPIFTQWDTLNDPDVRATENPSQGGIGTAEAFAKVYGILANGGKDAEGRVLLSEERIKELSTGGKTRKDKCNGLQVRYNKGIRFCGEVSKWMSTSRSLKTKQL